MDLYVTSGCCSPVHPSLTTRSPVHSSISVPPKSLGVKSDYLGGGFAGRSTFGNRTDNFGIGNTRRPSNCHQRVKRATRVSATLMNDHFATLGVTQNASLREIKSAYRQLAKQYHPDVCREDQCQMTFVQINNAYEHALHFITGPQYAFSDCEAEDWDLEGCREELEDWENWMGFEGAGTLDFSAHDFSSAFSDYHT